MRTGKRLQDRLTELVVTFDEVPHPIFEMPPTTHTANELVIRLQPDESITLTILAKNPGEGMRLKPVSLALDLGETFKTRSLDAYERLLMDTVKGNLTLFMRRDELDAAWAWIDPIRAGWEQYDEAAEDLHRRHLGTRGLQRHDGSRRICAGMTNSDPPATNVPPTSDSLSRDARRQQIAAICGAAIAARGLASLVVSGGKSPVKLFELLRTQALDWSRVCIALADERWVDPVGPGSNEKLVRDVLLQGEAAAARFIGLKNGAPTPGSGRRVGMGDLRARAPPVRCRGARHGR